jgi:hypothetical protein
MRGKTGKREDREERRQGREKTGKREDREERRHARGASSRLLVHVAARWPSPAVERRTVEEGDELVARALHAQRNRDG